MFILQNAGKFNLFRFSSRKLASVSHPGTECARLARKKDKTATVAFADETSEALASLTAMIEAEEIRPIVDRVYPMEEAAAAHQRVETEKRVGAIVIAIGDRPQPSNR